MKTPYELSVSFLEGLSNMRSGMLDKNSKQTPDLYIKRTKALINALNLDLNDIKFIHIAGTAGKGSVSNLIYQGILRENKKVGLFTSPFVTSTIEKISVSGKFIAPNSFVTFTEKLKTAIDRVYNETSFGCPSYFECITAIAFMYFIEQKCEYVVLEVGLGGRYDSTNIIEKPVITAITNIDLDHTEILGKTLNKIAYEKAGIIKKGSNFYTTEIRPSLIKKFKNICNENGTVFNPIPAQKLSIIEKNYSLANAIIKKLGFNKITKNDVFKKLPARFETMERNPTIIIDGAHNPAKIESTYQNWKSLNVKGKRILIIGMASNKDAKASLKNLVPLADVVYITRLLSPFRKAMEPKDLSKIVKKYAKRNIQVYITLDPIYAFKVAKKQLTKKDSLLVTGSFFLAGDIRSIYYSETFILSKRACK